jgi:hypothetical protein
MSAVATPSPRDRAGPRLIVVGNCQSVGLANCLRAMLPEASVEQVWANKVTDWDALAEAHDHLVVQGRRWRTEPLFRTDLGARLLAFPEVAFPAFHPDFVYVETPSGYLRGRTSVYNSALALFGWLQGLSVAETLALFGPETFERLGYLRMRHPSARVLVEAAADTDIPLDRLLRGWLRQSPFMHTLNHPCLRVSADLARAVAARLGLPVAVERPEEVIADHLDDRILPVYPAVAERFGLTGSYDFAWYGEHFGLEEMVARSHAMYAEHGAAGIACERFRTAPWIELAASLRRTQVAPGGARRTHPYADLPPDRFWRSAVAEVPAAEVDPVRDAPFRIAPETRVATAGSCFAQHIARGLSARGFRHMVTEAPPPSLSPAEAAAAGFGVFSARYGNIYTARQLLQLMERAHGWFAPAEPGWTRDDGRVADPFRPLAEPAGFATEDDMLAARAPHLAAVREMFASLEVFVFTLGLTEAWRSWQDGAVFPLAPGVVAGTPDPTRHEFVNFGVADVVRDLRSFLARLREVNPAARSIITVSPVPLVATAEDRHVMVSNAASKAILRAAADEVAREDPSVWYFPSFEVITGAFNRGAYFEADLRAVTADGIAHVMRLFFRHAAGDDAPADEAMTAEAEALLGIVCDEEEIAR